MVQLAQLGAMVPSCACLLLSLIVAVSAHTSLIYPKPRNVRCSISCDIGPRGLRFSPQLLPNDDRCFLLQLPRRMRAALQPGHARDSHRRSCAQAIDSSLPEWSGGKAPYRWQPYGDYPCACRNGTHACESAQTCLWFSVGCTIGCAECDGGTKGGSNPNRKDRCGSGMKATINDPMFRTV